MTRRVVVALGIGQCINWGVLYYAFTVLVVPVSKDLALSPWVATGAFSLALLVSALLSPVIGSWIDRGHGPAMMRAGGWAAAALLVLWASAPGLASLFVAWIGLGACMATTLYEPAFAIVARAEPDPARRLRALALVTVFGGVASTVFLPSTDLLVRVVGWRAAVVALAVAVALSTLMTQAVVFGRLKPEEPADRSRRQASQSALDDDAERVFAWAVLTFAFASFASAGLTANLVPALAERHVSPTTTALLGSAFGAMQLPGRLLLSAGALSGSPVRLVVLSLLLQALGLVGVALAPSVAWVAAALMVFAGGAGLATLARPHFTQTCFGVDRSGYLNGRLARWQQLARATGPISAAALAAAIGYGAVVGVLAAIFAALAMASYRLSVRRSRPSEQPLDQADGSYWTSKPMSNCCCPEPADTSAAWRCPGSGTPGKTVNRQTMKALLTEQALLRLSPAEYRFCPDAHCPTVYYGADGVSFSTQDVRVAVWQKRPFGDRQVCYCFGESEDAIRAEILAHGHSAAIERIREQITADRCVCVVRNPRGSCCLGDVSAAIERVTLDLRRHA